MLGQNIKYLRKKKGLTQDQLADKLGVKRAMIGSYEEERAMPKLDTLKILCHYFSVTLDDLVNADLSNDYEMSVMTKDFKGQSLRILSTIVDYHNNELITVVPQKASAGYLVGYSDPDFIESLPRLSIELPEMSRERTYRAFQISGDSMEPIPSGSYIICEYLHNWYDVKSGKPYIVITSTDGIVYKRIFFSGNEAIMLKSDNPIYEPYYMKFNEIMEFWKAIGFISFKLPEPDEITMNKLAFMMQKLKDEVEILKENKNNN